MKSIKPLLLVGLLAGFTQSSLAQPAMSVSNMEAHEVCEGIEPADWGKVQVDDSHKDAHGNLLSFQITCPDRTKPNFAQCIHYCTTLVFSCDDLGHADSYTRDYNTSTDPSHCNCTPAEYYSPQSCHPDQ